MVTLSDYLSDYLNFGTGARYRGVCIIFLVLVLVVAALLLCIVIITISSFPHLFLVISSFCSLYFPLSISLRLVARWA